ncbi:MAG: hypothetical protein IMW98_09815 [Firmicutes bacterium]|nr:hypothetical protein [Bacillota bacterium]
MSDERPYQEWAMPGGATAPPAPPAMEMQLRWLIQQELARMMGAAQGQGPQEGPRAPQDGARGAAPQAPSAAWPAAAGWPAAPPVAPGMAWPAAVPAGLPGYPPGQAAPPPASDGRADGRADARPAADASQEQGGKGGKAAGGAGNGDEAELTQRLADNLKKLKTVLAETQTIAKQMEQLLAQSTGGRSARGEEVDRQGEDGRRGGRGDDGRGEGGGPMEARQRAWGTWLSLR